MRHLLDCGRISMSAGRLRLLKERADNGDNKPNGENGELVLMQSVYILKGG